MSPKHDPSAPGSPPGSLAGTVSEVRRVGDTVRREIRPSSLAIHALLRHMKDVGFAGAPRFLGIDGDRREVLSYVEGSTLDTADMPGLSIEALTAMGRLVRAFHDAVRDFPATDNRPWMYPPVRDVPGELIVCHNDISPRNTVFRDGMPVALIDWDLAHPAPAVWDVAHAVWQFVIARRQGRPARETEDCLRRIVALLDGYGLPNTMRRGFAEILAVRVERTMAGIAALAEAGEPAFVRFREQGVLDDLADDHAWITAHAGEITALTGRQT